MNGEPGWAGRRVPACLLALGLYKSYCKPIVLLRAVWQLLSCVSSYSDSEGHWATPGLSRKGVLGRNEQLISGCGVHTTGAQRQGGGLSHLPSKHLLSTYYVPGPSSMPGTQARESWLVA